MAAAEPSSFYNEGQYDSQGRILCRACQALADLAESEVRAARSLRRAGYGSLALTLVSFIFNPVLLVTIFALLSGGGTLFSILRSEDHRKLLGGHLVPVLVVSLISVGLSALVGLATLLGLASLFAR